MGGAEEEEEEEEAATAAVVETAFSCATSALGELLASTSSAACFLQLPTWRVPGKLGERFLNKSPRLALPFLPAGDTISTS